MFFNHRFAPRNQNIKLRVGRRFLPWVEFLEERVVPAGDVVLDWNQIALDAIRNLKPAPPVAARDLAIESVAVFDAVEATDGTYSSYLINFSASEGSSRTAAAAVAAHDTLVALFPIRQAVFDQAVAATLSAVPAGPARDSGMALGRDVASQILGIRAGDHSGTSTPYTPGSGLGIWQPTPPAFAAAVLPGWGNVTPFALTSSSQFLPPPPPALDSPEYAQALQEVASLGSNGTTTPSARTPEQTEIANFWADGAATVTPPGHWNVIAQDVAQSRGLDTVQNARLFALLNIALADAAITAWDAKYLYNFWRPITAIRQGSAGTPADPGWTSLLVTPAFPSYISGHSTFSAAAATVLAAYFGTDQVPFSSTSDALPGVTRTFSGFSQAAAEAGQSRIYGGIHYQFDNQAGLRSGQQIGQYVSQNFLGSLVSPDQRYVIQLYQDLLHRAPDPGGLATFTSALAQGATRPAVASTIASSVEYRILAIRGLYERYLHRQADPDGVFHFLLFLARGGNLEQAAAIIVASPEYFNLQGGGTTEGFVQVLYQDVLERSVDPGAQEMFVQALDNGVSRLDVCRLIVTSTECRQRLLQDDYQLCLHRSVDREGQQFWGALLDQGIKEEVVLAGIIGSQEYFARLLL